MKRAEGEVRISYPVIPGVRAEVTITAEHLVHVQGLRRREIPLAALTAFGYRDRGRALLGMSSNELLLRREAGGSVRVEAVSFDLRHPECHQVLEALRRVKPAADTTGLPWPEAAARLGVPVRAWYDALLNPRATLGIVICAAGAFAGATMSGMEASAPERLGHGIAVLACWALGITLVVLGVRAARRRE
jgi:hypothetical protein